MHVAQSIISRLCVQGDQERRVLHMAASIRLRHLRNRFLSATSTVQALPGAHRGSDQTVRNRLHSAGPRARRPYRGPVLTQRHRLNRVQWAQRRLWTVRHYWRHIWFNDESYFFLQRHGGKRGIYRRPNERYAQTCVNEAPPHGVGCGYLYRRKPLTACPRRTERAIRC